MVSLLCKLQPTGSGLQFEPSAIDAPRADGLPNYTVDTLSALRARLDTSDSIYVLLGADAFLGLPAWKSHDTLLSVADWIVVSRPGVPLQGMEQLHLSSQQLQRVHLLEGVHEPASATDIRALLKSRSNCIDVLPGSILNYIRTHHLYET
jgi:nicotinate-nucleotide adenylyltransferase